MLIFMLSSNMKRKTADQFVEESYEGNKGKNQAFYALT